MTHVPRLGWFVATEVAAALSSAPHLQGERVRASARVEPRRLLVRLALPNGETAQLPARREHSRGEYAGELELVLHDAASHECVTRYRWVPSGPPGDRPAGLEFDLVFDVTARPDATAPESLLAGRLRLTD